MIERRRREQHAGDGTDAASSATKPVDTAISNAPDQSEKTSVSMQLEVALYIESISAELRQMAQAADLEALQYFLEMARLEASIQVERRASQDPV